MATRILKEQMTRTEAVLFFIGGITGLWSLILFLTELPRIYLWWSTKFGLVVFLASMFSMTARQYYYEEGKEKGYVATFVYIAMLVAIAYYLWVA